jgi:hypothetical protein
MIIGCRDRMITRQRARALLQAMSFRRVGDPLSGEATDIAGDATGRPLFRSDTS